MEVTWDSLGVTGGVDVKLKETLNAVRKDPETNRDDPNSYSRRRERQAAQYKVVKKEIAKYNDIISAELRPRIGETIVLGEHKNVFNSSQAILSEPVERQATQTELKLRNIVNKLRRGRREAAEKLFPKAPGHKEAELVRIESELRKLMAAELREAKRLRTIKSKGHRRSKRKSDQREQAKLMERLLHEDPKAAEKLREEWELKRAEARMMLGTKARRQWAKMAKRFGGKEMERTINAAHMDADGFKQYLNTMSGKTAADEAEDSTGDDEDDGGSAEGPEPATAERSGIWQMPFIKRAREIREIQQRTGIDPHDDYSIGRNDLPDESTQTKDFLISKRQGQNAQLKNATESPGEEPPKPVSSKFGIADEIKAAAPEPEVQSELDLMSFVMRPKKPASVPAAPPVEEVDDTPSFNAKFFSKGRKGPSKEILDSNDKELSQEELVRMAFQPDGDEAEKDFAEKLELGEMQALEELHSREKPAVLEGWGNWCAAGYVDSRVKQEQDKAASRLSEAKKKKLRELKKQGLVKIHPKACKPADKYFITRLPPKYKTPGQYYGALRRHISDQFVSPLESQIASAPKMEVIKGRVISALKAEMPK